MQKLYAMALADAKLPHGGGDGLSFAVAERSGNGLSGVVLTEFAGKGGHYDLTFEAKDLLTGKTLKPGTISVAPYQVRVLQATGSKKSNGTKAAKR